MATADIEMKDFPVVSTASSTDTVVLNATVNGEKANVQIKISDLATVVAGVVNPFRKQYQLTSSHDLNNIADGIYGQSDVNRPSNSPSTAYNFILLQYSNLVRNDIVQIVYSGNSREIIMRYKFSGSWGSWKVMGTFN